MKNNEISILYVDSESHNLNAFKAYYRTNSRYKIFTSLSAEEGIKVFEDSAIEIIITDQKTPDVVGTEFLDGFPLKFPDPIKIVVTPHNDTSKVEKALEERKIFAFLEKPWKMEDLEKLIIDACDEYSRRVAYSSPL